LAHVDVVGVVPSPLPLPSLGKMAEFKSACDEHGGLFAGVCTARGRRASNEDAHLLLCNWSGAPRQPRASLFAVCDGHGGAAAAQWISQHISSGIRSALDEALWHSDDHRRDAVEQCFSLLDGALNESLGRASYACGTTCIAAVLWDPAPSNAEVQISPEKAVSRTVCCRRSARSRSPAPSSKTPVRQLLFANLGDSRGLLIRRGEAVAETSDHKPDAPSELARIRAAGGFVSWRSPEDAARVDGELACSRAFGDFRWKATAAKPDGNKVSPVPEISEMSVLDGDVVLLACDGVFDVFSSEQVAALVLEMLIKHAGDSEEAARAVTQAALDKGTTDNVTCVIVQVTRSGGRSHPVAVRHFD